MQRLIFHIDINSAYLSWEAMRRVREGGEDLRLIASAIGGDRDKRTGIILAKSIPAKKMGVKTGEPVAAALRKCPELYLAPPDFHLYERCSQAFTAICQEYTPALEKFSIDECFLDMTGMQEIYPDPIATAHEIKNRIRDTLGFTANIGIGSNKLLAKMASDFEKPDRVHTLFYEEIPTKLWPLPVGELFTVGHSTAERLIALRLRTIGDLARMPLSALQSSLGPRSGLHLHNYANGVDDSPVLAAPEEAKGFSISTTLEEDVTTTAQAYHIMLALCDSVTSRMRAADVKTTCVGVTIRDNDFKNRSHQKKLMEPTDITDEIYQLCQQLFDQLWDKRTPLRLLGVSLTNLVHSEATQLSLFPDEQKEKSGRMDKAVDALRSRFGSDIIMRGSFYQSSLNVGRKYKAQMDTQPDSEG